MQVRRPCRRYCLLRSALYLLICTAIGSTTILSYEFYLKNFSDFRNDRFRTFVIDETDVDDARVKPTGNIQLLTEDFFNSTHLACRYPKLNIDNRDIWQLLDPVTSSQPDCEKSSNWVYVDNGS